MAMASTMASRVASICRGYISHTPEIVSAPLLRPHPRLPRTLQPLQSRFSHTIPKPTIPPQDADLSSSADATKSRKLLEPHYRLTFTCVPCGGRSSHIVSKQGYHKGSTLIICPSCHNRHVISDNLRIFGDRKINVEELLREKGQLVKRGSLSEYDDLEFWQDTPAESSHAGEAGAASAGREERGGEEDEARRLRETRDPSSQATDPPLPASSVLPGDSGSRPSLRGASHQDATPSTRRQYHTSPVLHDRIQDRIAKGKIKKDLAPWQLKMIKKFDKRKGNHGVKSKVQSEMQFEVPSVPSTMQHQKEPPADSSSSFQIRRVGIAPGPPDEEPPRRSPADYEGVRKVGSDNRVFGRMIVPQVRRVVGDLHFNGPRFVQLNDDKRSPVVQVKPGIVFRRRPVGGISEKLVAALSAPLPETQPDDPHSYGPTEPLRVISQRRGFFRPSGVGPVPAPSANEEGESSQ